VAILVARYVGRDRRVIAVVGEPIDATIFATQDDVAEALPAASSPAP